MFNVGGQRIYEVEFKLKMVSCDEVSDKLSAYKVVDTLHVTKPQNGFDRFYMSSQDILKIFDFFVVWYKLYTFNRPRRLAAHRASSPRHGDVCYHHCELALKLSRLSAVTTSS